ncbi:MAG: prepilin-type N-terminal cleavage/methylation domain-containing protein [Candidatus Berkelbacteria bacterium]|nr:prepilin-type N-terminal cleavage/methylation domain-containing protein [Candidatus Berkelbacteria bacterium]
MKKIKSGFTLIELLVVIAIIAILALVVIVSYDGVKKRARDTRRRADIETLASAFAMYRLDAKTYELPSAEVTSISGYVNCGAKSIGAYLKTNGYLSQMIKDPSHDSTSGPICTADYMYFGGPTTCTSDVASVYAKLESTSAGDTAAGVCGYTTASIPTNGMNLAKDLN